MKRVTVMPILYALLAALTGLSLGGAADARVGHPAAAVSIAVVRPLAPASAVAARAAAALRPAPVAPRRILIAPLRLSVLPLAMNPARRRE